VELKLENWPIDRLVGYARNPRKNDAHVNRMAESIKEFGFTVPVLAKSDGTVIDGHLRLKAANALQLETVPVIVADHMTEAQVKAFRILVNRSVAWAEWDVELLKLEFDDLTELDFNLDLTGFDTDARDNILKEPEIPPEDKSTQDEHKYTLTVTFENDAEQEDLFLELRDRGFKVKV